MQTIRNSKRAMANVRRLRACRKAKGLTQSDLIKVVGLRDVKTIFSYESGKYAPSLENYNKLARFFGWELIEAPPQIRKKKMKPKIRVTSKQLFDGKGDEDFVVLSKTRKIEIEEEKLKRKVQEREKALNFSFNIDECYKIDGFVFKYLGKQGIHHCFEEINGGWTRTYTDVQLIGRKINAT